MAANIIEKWKSKDEQTLIKKFLTTRKLSYLVDLYRPYVHLVYGIAYHHVGDDQQSQEICIKIFKKLARDIPKQEIRIFKSWLYIVTKNYCDKWLIAHKNQPSAAQLAATQEHTTNSGFTIYDRDDRSFEEEISNMEHEILNTKKEQEKCVELFFKEQKCFQEIADITGFELKNIKQHIKNAKKNINIYH